MEMEFQKQGGESKGLLVCIWIKATATGKAVAVFCLEYVLETKQAFLTR